MLSALLVAVAICAIAMLLVWAISVRLTNAGVVDVAWSALFSVVAVAYALLGTGDRLRRAVAAGMMVFWSLRLASHLWRRVVGHLQTEDPRYATLRRAWGTKASLKMFVFFQFQGLTVVALSIPVLLASRNESAALGGFEYAGLAIWLIALIGESAADAQLARFKADPSNRGAVCSNGLWRLSRHPNYFFEWLIWCAFFVFALGSPRGWIAAYCPLLMLWFLYKVTGIPATEEHALASRGESYREYQRTTSPFIPWFPKS